MASENHHFHGWLLGQSNFTVNVAVLSQEGVSFVHAHREVPNGVSVSLCFERVLTRPTAHPRHELLSVALVVDTSTGPKKG